MLLDASSAGSSTGGWYDYLLLSDGAFSVEEAANMFPNSFAHCGEGRSLHNARIAADVAAFVAEPSELALRQHMLNLIRTAWDRRNYEEGSSSFSSSSSSSGANSGNRSRGSRGLDPRWIMQRIMQRWGAAAMAKFGVDDAYFSASADPHAVLLAGSGGFAAAVGPISLPEAGRELLYRLQDCPGHGASLDPAGYLEALLSFIFSQQQKDFQQLHGSSGMPKSYDSELPFLLNTRSPPIAAPGAAAEAGQAGLHTLLQLLTGDEVYGLLDHAWDNYTTFCSAYEDAGGSSIAHLVSAACAAATQAVMPSCAAIDEVSKQLDQKQQEADLLRTALEVIQSKADEWQARHRAAQAATSKESKFLDELWQVFATYRSKLNHKYHSISQYTGIIFSDELKERLPQLK
ncbi:hypothetical protein OEZ86_014661 [Tetradesmus obliquus]|nr:hypothetical protein OEZ86_014661 [Tetradesmus obliquus]